MKIAVRHENGTKNLFNLIGDFDINAARQAVTEDVPTARAILIECPRPIVDQVAEVA